MKYIYLTELDGGRYYPSVLGTGKTEKESHRAAYRAFKKGWKAYDMDDPLPSLKEMVEEFTQTMKYEIGKGFLYSQLHGWDEEEGI